MGAILVAALLLGCVETPPPQPAASKGPVDHFLATVIGGRWGILPATKETCEAEAQRYQSMSGSVSVSARCFPIGATSCQLLSQQTASMDLKSRRYLYSACRIGV